MRFQTLSLGVFAFISTNIDDLFFLLALFSDTRFLKREIILGQFLGMTTLLFSSAAIGIFTQSYLHSWVKFFGIFPILLGLRAIFSLKNSNKILEKQELTFSSLKQYHVLMVLGVTLANGGDNLGVYVPLFSTHSLLDSIIISIVFFVMTGLWCWLSYRITHLPQLTSLVKRYGSILFPWVLVALGAQILLSH